MKKKKKKLERNRMCALKIVMDTAADRDGSKEGISTNE